MDRERVVWSLTLVWFVCATVGGAFMVVRLVTSPMPPAPSPEQSRFGH